MTAHRVAELEGALLDAAVCKVLGLVLSPDSVRANPFSTSWGLAGPIIERARIDILQFDNGAVAFCGAHHKLDAGGCLFDFEVSLAELAPTPLVAAMRAYVASKFGDTVELT